MSTALARIEGLPDRPIKRIEEITSTFAAIQDKVNLVTPVIRADYIPDMHQVSLRIVVIDPTVTAEKTGDFTAYRGKDVYRDPKICKEDERAISKTGLLKLLDAAGGTIVESRRVDNRQDPDLVEWQVVIELKQLDGNLIRRTGTKTVDLRQEKTGGWTGARVAKAREHMESVAESKAMLRAIRAALSIQQKYSVADLAKPFVVPALVPDLDCRDPEIKRMVAAKALGMDLYGQRPALAAHAQAIPAEIVDEDTGEVLEDGDFPDIPPPEKPAPAPSDVHQCGCPCGCGAEITATVSAMTSERVGAPRCRICYPGRPEFDYTKHKHLATLGLPKNPGMTPHQAHQLSQARPAGGGR